MNRALRPSRQPGCELEVIEGELLVLHPAHNKVLYCNETGSLIWQLCDGSRNVNEIIQLLEEAFPEQGPRIGGDVERTLRELECHGVIELVEQKEDLK